jgi:hemoglobin-like flavoprotein
MEAAMLHLEQKTIIRSTFAQFAAVATVAASLFYSRLFELAPQTAMLFRYPLGTAGMARQGSKLIETLNVAVEYLDSPEQLAPIIEQLGRRHVAYGVEPAHYDAVGATLLWTLQQVLGNGYTAEVEAAWATLYRQLADTMKRAADEASIAVGAERPPTTLGVEPGER